MALATKRSATLLITTAIQKTLNTTVTTIDLSKTARMRERNRKEVALVAMPPNTASRWKIEWQCAIGAARNPSR